VLILWLNAAMTDLHWSIQVNPPEEGVAELRDELARHNVQYSSIAGSRDLALFVRDASGRLVGGVIGNLWGGVLEIDFLWLHAGLRGQGLGAQILLRFEEEAKAHGALIAFLNTYSFQAPAFYQKHGYRITDTVDGYPDGVKKYFLKKSLA
jgi:GNAT superfamily N-acetyltransferase